MQSARYKKGECQKMSMILTEASNYYHSLDEMHHDEPVVPIVSEDSEFRGIKNIGPAKWLTGGQADPINGLTAEIRKGASHIEITAPGTGRGDQSNPTFEYFDKGKKEEMRMLAKINKVNITTHSTPSAWGIAGFNGEGFSKQQQQQSITEIKKAIDFAQEVADGGSVVIHTGEFPRPFISKDISQGDYQFRTYGDEDKDAVFYLVNNKNGKLISSVRKDQFVFKPEQDVNTDGTPKWLMGSDGQPVKDDITGKEIPVWKWDEKTQAIQTKKMTFQEFSEDMKKQNPDLKTDADVARQFFMEQQQGEISHQLGQAKQFEAEYVHGLKIREQILERLNWMKGLQEKTPKEEWDKIKPHLLQQAAMMDRRGGVLPGEDDPIKVMNRILVENEKNIAYGREITLSGRRQAQQALEEFQKNVVNMEDYALAQSAKGYTDLAMYAFDRSKKTSKPIALTLENVYPETYGSTADEIINVVNKTRDEFTRRLMLERKLSKDEAKEAAKNHVKITFDTGHLNMWRKYFQQKEGETPDEADKRFKKWYLGQVEKLAKEGIIGNLHLADNFGYDDAHLVVGQGNVPIKEVMEIMKKHGFKDKIAVEGGFNQGREGFHDVWNLMGSPIYGIGKTFGSGFGSFQHAHLGYNAPANYIVGAYSPSNEWRLWSEVPLE